MSMVNKSQRCPSHIFNRTHTYIVYTYIDTHPCHETLLNPVNITSCSNLQVYICICIVYLSHKAYAWRLLCSCFVVMTHLFSYYRDCDFLPNTELHKGLQVHVCIHIRFRDVYIHMCMYLFEVEKPQ